MLTGNPMGLTLKWSQYVSMLSDCTTRKPSRRTMIVQRSLLPYDPPPSVTQTPLEVVWHVPSVALTGLAQRNVGRAAVTSKYADGDTGAQTGAVGATVGDGVLAIACEWVE